MLQLILSQDTEKALDGIRNLEEERDFACWCCYKCTLFHFNTMKSVQDWALCIHGPFLQHLSWNQLKQTNRNSGYWSLICLQPLCDTPYGFSCVSHCFPHNSHWLLPEGQQEKDIKKGQSSGCPQPFAIPRNSLSYSAGASRPKEIPKWVEKNTRCQNT